jgi:beta-galactosidase
VAASGLLGLQKIAVSAEGIDPGRPLTLRLVFVEPQYETPGSRVFSIAALGRELVRDLDIAAEAGGPWRSLAKEFPGLRLSSRPDGTGVLELDFAAKVGEPLLCGIELVQSPDPP